MKSMTGYGYAEASSERGQISVELKSYNNRYLEVQQNLSYLLSPFEAEIESAIKTVAKRGHIDVYIRLKELESEMEVTVDTKVVSAYAAAFKEIARAAEQPMTITLADFLAQDGVLITTKKRESEVYRELLFDTLDIAIEQLVFSKEREGASTKEDLLRLGTILQTGQAVFSDHADELEVLLERQLKERFAELLGDQGWEEQRVLQEIGVLLVRYSIYEEISRLGAHLGEYFTLLEATDPVGKRLDFLCQEMLREINTIGSKSQLVELNLQVVEMKDALENIREQIRNIE